MDCCQAHGLFLTLTAYTSMTQDITWVIAGSSAGTLGNMEMWTLTPPAVTFSRQRTCPCWVAPWLHQSWVRQLWVVFSWESLERSLLSCPEWESAHPCLPSPNAHWISWDYLLNIRFALKPLTQNLLWGESKVRLRIPELLPCLRESLLCAQEASSFSSLSLSPWTSILLRNIACPCMSGAAVTSYFPSKASMQPVWARTVVRC